MTDPDNLRAALRELVALEDLKTQAEALHFAGPSGYYGGDWRGEYEAKRKDYIKRWPVALAAARSALAASARDEGRGELGMRVGVDPDGGMWIYIDGDAEREISGAAISVPYADLPAVGLLSERLATPPDRAAASAEGKAQQWPGVTGNRIREIFDREQPSGMNAGSQPRNFRSFHLGMIEAWHEYKVWASLAAPSAAQAGREEVARWWAPHGWQPLVEQAKSLVVSMLPLDEADRCSREQAIELLEAALAAAPSPAAAQGEPR